MVRWCPCPMFVRDACLVGGGERQEKDGRLYAFYSHYRGTLLVPQKVPSEGS